MVSGLYGERSVNDSFHGANVSLAQRAENEGEMRMLSESV